MRLKGARYIAESLKEHGLTHIFYMESILTRTLVEAEKLGITRVLAHSEKAAAYMADGYARAARRPGVCMAQSVGAANLAAGLQDAYWAHSPVISFTGSKPALFQYRNAYQEMIHNPLFDHLTKYNVKVEVLEQLPFLLPQAFREATTGAPRPVHLDLQGLAGEFIEEAEGDIEVIQDPVHRRYPARRPIPEPEDIKQCARMLMASEKPVLVVGRGAIISEAASEVVELAERLSVPVATSSDGKAVMPDVHPLFLGPTGSYGRPCANIVVAEADLVFFIGTGTGDQVTRDWTSPDPATCIIQLDIDPSEVGRNYPGAIGLVGDAKRTLRGILDCVGSVKSRRGTWAQRAKREVQAWRRSVEANRISDTIPIRPERLCQEITRVLPKDGVLVTDTGYSAIWSGTMIDLVHPDQEYFRAAGSLGWSLPAALGVKCAMPSRPVICFCGDGAFWYHLSELETASRLQKNLVVVVNNNGVMAQCAPFVHQAYGEQVGRREDLYRYGETDFAQLAASVGCLGFRVERPDQIAEAIQSAMRQGRPAVVDVRTDGDVHPAWTVHSP
jgi:acetolactate synthase-1/2/3 large subunit